MIVVIFRAELGQTDGAYFSMAKRLRQLAESTYGCIEITSVCENGQELTVSYWKSLEDIQRWKADPEHRHAQVLGKTKWYRSFHIDLAEIL